MSDNQLSLDQLLNEAAGNEPEAPATEDTDANLTDDQDEPSVSDEPETGAEDSSSPSSDDAKEEPKTEPKAKAEPKSNPIKDVRDKLNSEQKLRTKIDNAMKRFVNGDYSFKLKDYKNEDGTVNYDELIAAMDEADNDNKAKTNNITPEVQKELDRIEKEKIEIQKERLKIAMDKNLASMQVNLKLTSADINKFFKDALDQKRNPYQWIAQGGNIEDLYFILNKDSMIKAQVDAAVAEERAKWEGGKPSPSPNPATKSSTAQSKATIGLSLADIMKEIK